MVNGRVVVDPRWVEVETHGGCDCGPPPLAVVQLPVGKVGQLRRSRHSTIISLCSALAVGSEVVVYAGLSAWHPLLARFALPCSPICSRSRSLSCLLACLHGIWGGGRTPQPCALALRRAECPRSLSLPPSLPLSLSLCLSFSRA